MLNEQCYSLHYLLINVYEFIISYNGAAEEVDAEHRRAWICR